MRKAIIKNIANLKVSTFDKPAKDYGKRLDTIIKTARKNNPNLPIYVVGIYNPLYLNFPELTEMQTIVDNWNTMTEQITEKYQHVYFVPINDLLYKGLEGRLVLVKMVAKLPIIYCMRKTVSIPIILDMRL